MSSATVSPAQLRHALGHFPTGVTVVTTRDGAGDPVGTTASAVSSVSCEPPLVLVCLARSSLTLAALREHGAFTVNVLGADQRELSDNFALPGAVASWAGVAYELGELGAPHLDGALAALDCTVARLIPGGDHAIVLGHVRQVAARPGSPRALLHFRGAYAAVEGSP